MGSLSILRVRIGRDNVHHLTWAALTMTWAEAIRDETSGMGIRGPNWVATLRAVEALASISSTTVLDFPDLVELNRTDALDMIDCENV
jgi:hypothetical protein